MACDREKLYRKFVDAFVKSKSDLSKEKATRRAQERWNLIKIDEKQVHEEIMLLEKESNVRQSRNILFWAKVTQPSSTSANSDISIISSQSSSVDSIDDSSGISNASSSDFDLLQAGQVRKFPYLY